MGLRLGGVLARGGFLGLSVAAHLSVGAALCLSRGGPERPAGPVLPVELVAPEPAWSTDPPRPPARAASSGSPAAKPRSRRPQRSRAASHPRPLLFASALTSTAGPALAGPLPASAGEEPAGGGSDEPVKDGAAGDGEAAGRGRDAGRAPATPRAPRILASPTPSYPLSARRRRAEGVALIRVLVGRDGGVREVQLARSSGAADLDRSALEAARRWRFRPGSRGLETVEAWVNIPVRFRLEDVL